MPDFTPQNEDDIYKCPFSKYKGMRWEKVVERDPNYVEWVLYESKLVLSEMLVEYLEDLLEERPDDNPFDLDEPW